MTTTTGAQCESTSCDDINEIEDILATCLHLYDVDVKDGACYMLNLPEPRLRTPTVFDGTTPTFPQWARELRAYLNIIQFEYINLLDFAYDAEDPLTTEIMVLQIPAGVRQNAEIVHLTQARQDLRDEQALPPADAQRRDDALITRDLQQVQRDLDARNVLQDATTAAVRRAGELLGYLIMHSTKPNSESNNLLCRLQRTNIGWEMLRQLRHQYAAGARVQHYTFTKHCTSTTSMDRDITTVAIQDVSAYKMIHPVIDDVSTAINNVRGPIQQHLLLQVRPHHTWQEVRQMIDNLFANSYMHLPGQTIGNIDHVNNRGKGKSTSSASTSKCWVRSKLGHRVASCWFNNQKNINNIQQQQLPPQQQQFQLQGTSDQPISYTPPEGITTSTSSSYRNNNLSFSTNRDDRRYLPPQHDQ